MWKGLKKIPNHLYLTEVLLSDHFSYFTGLERSTSISFITFQVQCPRKCIYTYNRSEVLSLLRNRWRSVTAWHCISASTQRNQRLPFTIDIWVPLGGVKHYILMWTKYINICKDRRVRSEGNNMYKQRIEKYMFFLQIHCCNLWWVLWLFFLCVTCLTVYKYLVSI